MGVRIEFHGPFAMDACASSQLRSGYDRSGFTDGACDEIFSLIDSAQFSAGPAKVIVCIATMLPRVIVALFLRCILPKDCSEDLPSSRGFSRVIVVVTLALRVLDVRVAIVPVFS